MSAHAACPLFLPQAIRSSGRVFALLALIAVSFLQAGCLSSVRSSTKLGETWALVDDESPEAEPEEPNRPAAEAPLHTKPEAPEPPGQPSEAKIAAANNLLATQITQKTPGNLRPTQEDSHGWYCGNDPPIHLCLYHRQPRWRHRGLLQILEEHPRPVDVLQAGLFSTDPEVAATAVIGLARLQDKAGSRLSKQEILSPLLDVCQNEKLPLTTRAAAWESLGNLPWPAAAAAVNEHWDKSPGIQQAPDWETRERWIARAKHHPPRQDPRLQTTFVSAPAPLQALILDLLFPADAAPLAPPINEVLSGDSPESLRKRGLYLPYLRTAAPLEHLAIAFDSPEFTVREAAILGLGREGSPEARGHLSGIDEESPSLIGVAAANAWGVAGDQSQLLQLAGHKSYRVRRVVTQWLKPPRNPEEIELVLGLFTDSQRDVHLGMLERAQTWPDSVCRPLLKEAANRTPEINRERAGEFRKRLDQQETLVSDPEEPNSQPRPEPAELPHNSEDPQISSAQAIEIMGWIDQLETSPDSHVRQQAKQRLLEAGPTVLQVLEQYAEPLSDFRPARLQREILPQVDPIFRWTNQLSIPPDVASKDALRKLRAQAAVRTLPHLAICQLLDFAQGTTDSGLWNELLVIIDQDSRAPSRNIANLALTHENPHIRRQACQYFQAHYDASCRGNLEKLLRDEVATVRQAAVEALAQENDPTIQLRFIERLADTDAEVRLAAAVALAKHQQVEGNDALRRMTYLRSEPLRLKTAKAIAQLSDPSWVPTLIRLLDDSSAVRGVALESLPLLVEDPQLMAQLTATRSTQDKVQLWEQWSEENQVVEASVAQK